MKYITFLIIAGLPFVTLAATAPSDFKGLVGLLNGIIDILIPIIFTLTFLTISWGVIKTWIIEGGSAESAAKGKSIVLVGVLVLVVMVSIWGILAFLRNGLFGS